LKFRNIKTEYTTIASESIIYGNLLAMFAYKTKHFLEYQAIYDFSFARIYNRLCPEICAKFIPFSVKCQLQLIGFMFLARTGRWFWSCSKIMYVEISFVCTKKVIF